LVTTGRPACLNCSSPLVPTTTASAYLAHSTRLHLPPAQVGRGTGSGVGTYLTQVGTPYLSCHYYHHYLPHRRVQLQNRVGFPRRVCLPLQPAYLQLQTCSALQVTCRNWVPAQDHLEQNCPYLPLYPTHLRNLWEPTYRPHYHWLRTGIQTYHLPAFLPHLVTLCRASPTNLNYRTLRQLRWGRQVQFWGAGRRPTTWVQAPGRPLSLQARIKAWVQFPAGWEAQNYRGGLVLTGTYWVTSSQVKKNHCSGVTLPGSTTTGSVQTMRLPTRFW